MYTGYLGPEGSFSHEAAEDLRQRTGVEIRPYAEIAVAIQALLAGEVETALVPIENSIEGAVNVTLDALAEEQDLFIQREILWPIRQTLLAPGDFAGEPIEIYSHPQAFGQCRRSISRLFPGARLVPVSSTALAAQMVSEMGGPRAALGSASAASVFGLRILRRNMQDYPNNLTRFVLLGRHPLEPEGPAKTSIVFSLAEDRPGGLYAVLGDFANAGLNLTKIESRPRKDLLGRYYFFVDIEADHRDPALREALAACERRTTYFRLLGSYRRETLPNKQEIQPK